MVKEIRLRVENHADGALRSADESVMCRAALGRSIMVMQRFLVPKIPGSSPGAPAIFQKNSIYSVLLLKRGIGRHYSFLNGPAAVSSEDQPYFYLISTGCFEENMVPERNCSILRKGHESVTSRVYGFSTLNWANIVQRSKEI